MKLSYFCLFQVSLFFPISFSIICLFLIILPLYVDPIKQIIATAILLTGWPVHYFFVQKKNLSPCIGNFSSKFLGYHDMITIAVSVHASVSVVIIFSTLYN